jgi:hypothetical protein
VKSASGFDELLLDPACTVVTASAGRRFDRGSVIGRSSLEEFADDG